MIKLGLKLKNKQDWSIYTIELLVVFIGITAGFILNNLREDYKEQKHEYKYLNSLNEDLLAEKEQLDSLIVFAEYKLSTIGSLVETFSSGNENIDTALRIVGEIMEYVNFTPIPYTYKDMINSGNLNIISEFNLKEEIVAYYHFQEEGKVIEKFYFDNINTYCIPLIYEIFDFRKIKFVSPNAYKTVKFTNMVNGYYVMLHQNIQYYNELRVLNKNILKLLSDQLND